MFNQNTKRAWFVICSSLALTLALTKCGPVAQSINKHTVIEPFSSELEAHTTSTATHSVATRSEEKIAIKPAWISSTPDSPASPPSIEPSSEINLKLTEEQRVELEEQNKTQITLSEGRNLSSYAASVELALNSEQMKSSHLDQVEISLEKQDAEHWSLQFKSTSPTALAVVLDNLEELTISTSRIAPKAN